MEPDEFVEEMLCAAERTERRAELQAYLDRHQVTPLLNELVAELLLHMPDNVPDFVVRYFESRFPDHVPRRRAYEGDGADRVMGPPAATSPPTVPESNDSSSVTSSSSEDDYVDELPPAPAPSRSRARRGVVFSEVVGPPADGAAEVPSYPKTDDELDRLKSHFAQTKLLSHMDEEQLDTFAMAMFPVSFSAGESIIRQGDDGDNLYIVASGQCSVWLKKGESKGPIKVAEYGPGGCFGELALLHNAPRAASVIADSAVQAWAIDRVSFKRIMMSSSLRQQDEYMNFIAKVAILAPLTSEERLRLGGAFVMEQYALGECIIREGDMGHTFYIIRRGKVECTKDLGGREPVVVKTLGAGDYFGEIALLTDKPRQATVTAAEETSCLRLERSAFKRLMGPLSSVLRRNMATYEAYMKKGSEE